MAARHDPLFLQGPVQAVPFLQVRLPSFQPHWTGAPIPRSPHPALRRDRVTGGDVAIVTWRLGGGDKVDRSGSRLFPISPASAPGSIRGLSGPAQAVSGPRVEPEGERWGGEIVPSSVNQSRCPRRRPGPMLKAIRTAMRGEGTAWLPACAGMTPWVVRVPSDTPPCGERSLDGVGHHIGLTERG